MAPRQNTSPLWTASASRSAPVHVRPLVPSATDNLQVQAFALAAMAKVGSLPDSTVLCFSQMHLLIFHMLFTPSRKRSLPGDAIAERGFLVSQNDRIQKGFQSHLPFTRLYDRLSVAICPLSLSINVSWISTGHRRSQHSVQTPS